MEELFPGLRGTDYRITSPADVRYNCIAWAVGEAWRRWWPADPATGYYWPDEVERAETLAAFMAVFALLGYAPCDSEELESGFEKIAIFTQPNGTPTHASRQLPQGRWTSKLGRMEDIEHDLHDISGELYGSVAQIMKRPSPLS
jgi:hypothetical protein